MRLGSVVQIHYGMHTLKHLSPYQCIPGEARTKKHNIGPQSSVGEGTLNPTDKIPLYFLEKEELDVWDVVPVAPWNIKAVAFRSRTSRGTWAPPAI